MKIFATVLVLLALIPCAQCLAQAPAANSPAVPVTSAPMSVADFLATLNVQGPDPDTAVLPPSPTFLSTLCQSNADCPTGQLCCYPCGIDGCDFVCMTPDHGHCPRIP